MRKLIPTSKKGGFFTGLIVFLIFAVLIFELVLLAIGYFYADEIRCNLIWCTFITHKSSTDVTQTESCTLNGEPINCSAIPDVPGDINKVINNTDLSDVVSALPDIDINASEVIDAVEDKIKGVITGS